TIWVAGEPVFHLNPYQLTFRIEPPSFPATLGIDFPFDVAEDPRDSTLVFSGYQTGLGLRVARFDPETRVATPILAATSASQLGVGDRVVVHPDGIIGVNAVTKILRIDPANPAAYQSFTPPGAISVRGLAIDLDGNWLTSGSPANSSAPRALMSVTRN